MRRALAIACCLALARCASRDHAARAPADAVEARPTPERPAAFAEVPVVARGEGSGGMYFKDYGTNPTYDTRAEPRSSFSIDVDTASYTLARAYLDRDELPPYEAIRVEELVNAFSYDYEPPSEATFSLVGEAAPSPTRPGYHVLHLGLKAREVSRERREGMRLVFVIDVSGSMAEGDRLGAVKRALAMLVGELDARDRVAVVAYGDAARVHLAETPGDDRARILAAIDALAPEGSTNVQAGLALAYGMLEGREGRVLLLSDGVANSGITEADAIWGSIARAAARGTSLVTVGFGMGNYHDALMERLAQLGGGNYHYVDRDSEAHRVFVEQLTGTLQVVASDVKLQLELDPRYVLRYRLVGYENRAMSAAEFEDAAKDAGELGAGHGVTAIYELKLAEPLPKDARLGVLRIRYKAPRGAESLALERPIPASVVRSSIEATSPATRLAIAVAGFGERLRGSYWARELAYSRLRALLPREWMGRPELVELARLIERAARLDRRSDRFASLPRAFDEVPVVATP